jgi:hypothetical protein
MTYPSPRCFEEVVVFLPFLIAGLVLPFLPFFVEVLEAYAIHMVHLIPNAVVTLALFVHACEMFVSVQSSVELFHHFFSLCQSPSVSLGPGTIPQARSLGGCYFRIHQRRRQEFIVLSIQNKWKNWKRQWLYVEVANDSPRLRLPSGPLLKIPAWTDALVLGLGGTQS